MKDCRTCQGTKPLDEFHRNCKARDGRLNHCKECVREANRARWRKRPRWATSEHRRAAHLRLTYGMTVEEYDAMAASQSGRCAICKAETDNLRIDHDHATDAVRGLLCHSCNTGLGHFRDSPEHLQSAVEYLRGNQP